jgi:hypothetical protein
MKLLIILFIIFVRAYLFLSIIRLEFPSLSMKIKHRVRIMSLIDVFRTFRWLVFFIKYKDSRNDANWFVEIYISKLVVIAIRNNCVNTIFTWCNIKFLLRCANV